MRPAIGADLAGIMNKALSRQPGDRYQSAGEIAEELRGFLGEMGIDEPDEMLARYLSDPKESAQELHQQSLQRLLAIGASAAKIDDVPKAQAALSRALALDDGNDRALKLLGSLGRRRRRNTLIVIGASVLVLALVGSGYVAWLRGEAATTDTSDAIGEAPGGPSTAPDDVEVSEGLSQEASQEAAPDATAETETAKGDAAKDAVPDGRRWVVFKPTPPNVSISVNGSPLKPYGPDFRRVRVKVGSNTFRFVGAEGCCKERVIRRRIPAGARDFELPVKLRYKPARLYLKGPTPAEATVRITLPGNRTVTGRIREILRIPMRSLDSSAQVEIRAPGYRTHKSVVRLRAGGDLTEHSFALERERETP
jgi:hypothetical protein